jgi:hypothetical protein
MEIDNLEVQTLIDSTTTSWFTYICKCKDIGTRATSDSFWQIARIDTAWNKQYPQNTEKNNIPSAEFIFIANDRANLTYSYN